MKKKELATLPENLLQPESKKALGDWIDSEQEYITAEEARQIVRNGGIVQVKNIFGKWETTYENFLACYQYRRAIKQAQPEPTDPHAALRAEYAKQVKEGTTGFYLWEFLYSEENEWRVIPFGEPPQFINPVQYRYTNISCYVALKGEPAKRMLRTEAQALQRSLGDAVEWTNPFGQKPVNLMFKDLSFDCEGIYTYKSKANLVKLDGVWMTREAAIAKYEAVKDKCDVWYGSENTIWITGLGERFALHSDGETIEYQLRAKPLKQVSLDPAIREGVIALLNELGVTK